MRIGYPSLEQFVGGHLHQDWDLDYGDHWEALNAFFWMSASFVPGLPGELDRLLAVATTDDELIRILHRHGAANTFRGPDGTVRAWLLEVKHRTEQHLVDG